VTGVRFYTKQSARKRHYTAAVLYISMAALTTANLISNFLIYAYA